VATLIGSQPDGGPSVNVEAAKARRADADQRVRRFQTAIAAGVDPASMVDAINQAQAERTAAQAEINNVQTSEAALDMTEVYAMIDSLGDVGAVLAEAEPASLQRLYQALNVQVQYEPAERAAYVTATPRVDSAGVRGARCAHAPHRRWRQRVQRSVDGRPAASSSRSGLTKGAMVRGAAPRGLPSCAGRCAMRAAAGQKGSVSLEEALPTGLGVIEISQFEPPPKGSSNFWNRQSLVKVRACPSQSVPLLK
jgi:hypothetical protein